MVPINAYGDEKPQSKHRVSNVPSMWNLIQSIRYQVKDEQDINLLKLFNHHSIELVIIEITQRVHRHYLTA